MNDEEKVAEVAPDKDFVIVEWRSFESVQGKETFKVVRRAVSLHGVRRPEGCHVTKFSDTSCQFCGKEVRKI